ncbi:MAG TPA: DUF1730 domain-containing protein, partial [Elusimicrobiales bacterium]|nr:DUF1730 domain-containing protein [Elusimicrobiales bacterium]
RPGEPVPLSGLEKFPLKYQKRKPLPDASGLYKGARFALCRDYHKEISARLEKILSAVGALAPGVEGKIFVDTSPVPEKFIAQKAGLGFQGKNTLLINRELGSFVVLGGIALSLSLEPDSPEERRCGDCRKCLEACPTCALSEKGLDIGRCLAYWLNSAFAEMPENMAQAARGMIAGCDICQEVCPWNSEGRNCAESLLSRRR